jgi:ATP phosphoribosyltransferase regulatory subunit
LIFPKSFMSSAWLLPEHIADVLPIQARRIEGLRRLLLDRAEAYGFELVMPPLLEHLESLLSGTGQALDLQTFKLVDQLSGRTLGLRADTTPQAARIDAHLLNHAGVTRLCYCGPVLHTLPAGTGSREQLQFGAEVFGHDGLEADLEIQDLALEALGAANIGGLLIDFADARVLRGVLAGLPIDAQRLHEVVSMLSHKDAAGVDALSSSFPDETRRALRSLLRLYGGDEVLQAARRELPMRAPIVAALDDLQWLSTHLKRLHPDVRIGFDLSDMSGYSYYSGTRFAVYGGNDSGTGSGFSDALARGGRYDEVGAVFGRSRPAVGFSLDVKVLAEQGRASASASAIRARWNEDAAFRDTLRRLREAGETVVCTLPGHDDEGHALRFDRELRMQGDEWVVNAI